VIREESNPNRPRPDSTGDATPKLLTFKCHVSARKPATSRITKYASRFSRKDDASSHPRASDRLMPRTTTIIDYGIGNLRSIEKALDHVGAAPVRTDDPAEIAGAERLVLPGVGAFGACIGEIRQRGLEAPIQEAAQSGTPLLGVCVGMQLLFETGEEHGAHDGLGLLEGRVIHFHAASENGAREEAPARKVPHMGWNTAEATRPESALLAGLGRSGGDAPYFYFVHSYHARPTHSGDVLATTTYGRAFPAVVQRNNVFGVQFHPEKSQQAGLRLLQNFATLRDA
jgi:glutamine amidotransferase